MKTLLKLEQEYQTNLAELQNTLYGFSHWLTELPYTKNLELLYPKWDLGTHEEYESHYIHKGTVTINLHYYDCDESTWDTDTCIHVPYTWVASYHNGNKESVEQEIVDAYVEYDKKCIENEKNSVRLRAIELGLIEE